MTQYFEQTFNTGHCIQFQRLPSSTCYHADTPEPVVELLEQLRHSRRKIRLYCKRSLNPALILVYSLMSDGLDCQGGSASTSSAVFAKGSFRNTAIK